MPIFEITISAIINTLLILALVLIYRFVLKNDWDTAQIGAGITGIIIYTLCIAFPYYFQGYSDLKDPRPGEALGWTKNAFIGGYAYIYSIKIYGFTWIVISIISILKGEYKLSYRSNLSIKIIFIIMGCFLISDLHNYENIINMVLE